MPDFKPFDATWWVLFVLTCIVIGAALYARLQVRKDERAEEAARRKVEAQLRDPQRSRQQKKRFD